MLGDRTKLLVASADVQILRGIQVPHPAGTPHHGRPSAGSRVKMILSFKNHRILCQNPEFWRILNTDSSGT